MCSRKTPGGDAERSRRVRGCVLDQTAVSGVGRDLHPIVRAGLEVDVGNMPLDGADAQYPLLGSLAAAFSLGNKAEDLDLAGGKAVAITSGATRSSAESLSRRLNAGGPGRGGAA